ncbi:MAG TPA: dienelactone hydrolase family protein [Pirellulaceae bacterium]|nr:dienelactone hydrolase family protein [Pirellulaceae bacterium]HMO90809.1 dienelactone hydrolase family protein [Pirellulaceae bacterium]HMP68060.1 dienelactone hydrolase family protein [Pirellulaceae bacterium]
MLFRYLTLIPVQIRILFACGFMVLLARVGELAGQDPALTRSQAESLIEELWKSVTESMREELEKELNEQVIKDGTMTMKLLSREFGKTPETGRSLYISLHGGGNTPARVNDRQWQNQIRLYQPDEGIYVAPRAPTDTWNLWHEAHIDGLLDRLILAHVLCRNVDPNRVYLMGYSAGGDGVFQLAPRTSDRWAAAAMMAGHPNETKPDGLRNLPFAIFMGGLDAAYERNKLAESWKLKLEELAKGDEGGYPHWVKIYPDKGHWMDGLDREALPWMAGQQRQCWPQKIVWMQDDVTHNRLYWLGVPSEAKAAYAVISAQVRGQTIDLNGDVAGVLLFLSDQLLDLDQPINVRWNGQDVFSGRVHRTKAAIERSLTERLDRDLAATAILELKRPE